MADNNAETKLLAVEKRLDEISKKMATESKVLLIVGLVVVAVMTGYFVYGLSEIRSILDPEILVATGNDMLGKQIPVLREQVQKQVIESAPVWAEDLSKQAIDAAPSAREKLEDQILAQTETTIEQYISVGDEEFKAVLTANRTSFEETLDALAEDQDFTDETVQIFVDALNAEMGQDMQDQAEQVFGTIVALREKIEKLAAGGNLTKEERNERDSLSILRRLKMSEANVQADRAEAAQKRKKLKEAKAKAKEGAEGEEKPAEGEEKPAEGEEKPAEEKPEEKESE